MLFGWSDRPALNLGTWRTHSEAMQIISGHYGKIKIHYEAPPSQGKRI